MDNDYRGSSAIGASTELGFGLGRVEGDPDSARRLLKTTGKCRPAADPPNRWLRLSAERGMVLIDQAEPFESEDAPVGRPPVVSNAMASKVLEALREGPAKQADVARALGRQPSDGTVRRVLEALERDGEVVRLGDGKRALPDCQNARTPIGNGTSGNVVEGTGGSSSTEGGDVPLATPEQESERARRLLANYCGRCGALFTPDEHGDVRCGNGHGRTA